MVRLVFRPYTQIRRTICTSVSLRASTRVSPGFTLFRHRSPSFGSQQICSYSNLSQVMIGRQCLPLTGFLPQSNKSTFTFITHHGLNTKILAQMLDSLVRVSRRVDKNHFVQDRDGTQNHHTQYYFSSSRQHCYQNKQSNRDMRPSRKRRTITSSIQAEVEQREYNSDCSPTFLATFSHNSN